MAAPRGTRHRPAPPGTARHRAPHGTQGANGTTNADSAKNEFFPPKTVKNGGNRTVPGTARHRAPHGTQGANGTSKNIF